MAQKKLLIIDDDVSLTELVKEFMTMNDFSVEAAHDPASGWDAFTKDPPDLVLLDVMLPGKSGFDICKDLRRVSDIPIVMLTARGTVIDRILGLELGADDYLAKPFEPRELLARIQAILRRGRRVEDTKILQFGDLSIDLNQRIAEVNSERIPLTTAEFELLSLFVSRPNEALNRDQISTKLRGTEWEALSRSVDVVMSRLRQKLGDDPKNPRFFKTIWGTGYMFIGKPSNE